MTIGRFGDGTRLALGVSVANDGHFTVFVQEEKNTRAFTIIGLGCRNIGRRMLQIVLRSK
jgi:hypothetical protein